MKKGKIFLALSLMVGIPALMYVLSLTVEKRYTAQVRLEVEAAGMRTEYPNVFKSIDDNMTRADPGTVSSQVQVITGSEVLGAALQKARENLPNKLKGDESVSNAYESLVRRLQIDSDPLSDVIGLRVTETDPELASELANDIAYAYADYVENKAKTSNSTLLTGLNTQVKTMKGRLAAIDSQIADYKAKAKVADSIAATQSSTSQLAANQQQLDSTRSQLDGTVSELAEAQRLLTGIPKTIVSQSSTQANPVPLGLETDLTRLRTQLADLQTQYTDEFPQVKGLKQQIRQGEANLKKYQTSIASGQVVAQNPAYQQQYANVLLLQGKVNNLKSAVASLQSTTNAVQTKVNDLPALQEKIDGLVRERLALEASYGQIVQRRDVTEAAEGARQPSVTVVSPALLPEAPSFPDTRLFILAGLAVGGFLAVLILMPRQEPVVAATDYLPTTYTAPPPPAAGV